MIPSHKLASLFEPSDRALEHWNNQVLSVAGLKALGGSISGLSLLRRKLGCARDL